MGWFGRDTDLTALLASLAEPGPVVVTGAAGIGKSRLLREAVARWPGDAAWCDLGAATSGADVEAGVAAALGLDAGASVEAALAGRPGTLLVLDDAEGVAALLGPLLESCREHAVAVGSRVRPPGDARLHVLAPLDREAARALYVERARRVVPGCDPDPDALCALVDALDGLPLALELAAARVRVHPPEDLVRRLPDALTSARAGGRHRSLEEALAASWDRLSPEARTALARLATVRGAFDADAFSAVARAAPEVLEDLLDASLVEVVSPGRLRLLETVRSFARARLDEADAQATAEAHARWVEAAAEAALDAASRADAWAAVDALRPDLAAAAARSPRAALLQARVAAERGPLVDPGPPPAGADGVAWAQARSRILARLGRHEVALVALDAVGAVEGAEALRIEAERVLHLVHLRPAAAAARVDALVARLGDGSPRDRAEARIAAALADGISGQLDRARGHLEAGRAALQGVDEPEVEARLLSYYALVADEAGLADARVHLRGAVERFRELGRPHREAMVLSWAGALDLHHGELVGARQALTRAAELAGRCGDPLLRAEILGHLVDLALEEGRLDEAEALQHEIVAASVRSPVLAAHTRSRDGLLALLRGDRARAARVLEEAAVALDELGRGALALAARAWLAVARGEDGPRELPGNVQRLHARLLRTLQQRRPRLHREGAWVEDRGGVRRDLEAKPVLRRLAAALAAAGPGGVVPRGALIAQVWPGERIRADSASARLHAAVRTLRREGLRDDLVTTDLDGELAYGLSADVEVSA